MLPPNIADIPYRVRSPLRDRMSVVLDQALVATADSIDLLDAMSAVRLHCEAAYDVVNTRAQSSTGNDRTRKFWQGQRKSFAADLPDSNAGSRSLHVSAPETVVSESSSISVGLSTAK